MKLQGHLDQCVTLGTAVGRSVTEEARQSSGGDEKTSLKVRSEGTWQTAPVLPLLPWRPEGKQGGDLLIR